MVGAAVPDFQGKLSPDEKEKVIAWLSAHWRKADCPFHGPTQWEIGDATGTQPFAGSGGGEPGSGVVLGGGSYPLVVLTCATCGYTIHINLFKVGLVTQRPEEPATPTPQVTSEQSAEPKAG
jgi:hypothetical protein